MEKTEIKDLSKKKKALGLIGGTIVGGIFGLAFGGILIVLGILLSLTIIGAIIGIPMIIFGIMVILSGALAGVFGGLGTSVGECPYCHNKVAIAFQKAITCRYCHKRLLVQGKELVLVQ